MNSTTGVCTSMCKYLFRAKLRNYLFLLLMFSLTANAQRKKVQVRQVDPRFTLSLESYFSTLTADEEFFYYVKNNTNQEYNIVVDITANYACVGERRFKLGINKVVYLAPNGEFTPKSDWVHYVLTSDLKGKAKECASKFEDSYTYLKSISYTISSVENLTEKKAAEEKKKQDDLANKKKLADEKARQEKEKLEKAKLEKDKLEKEKLAKEAANKKEVVKTGATVGAVSTTKAVSGSNEKKTTTTKTEKASNSTEKVQSAKSSTVDAENLALSKQQQAQQLEADRKAQEERRKAAEAVELAQKQKEYDSWKSKKAEEQKMQDAASFAASVGLMTIVGGWIYDGMGRVDPMFVLKPEDEKKRKFHMGLDFGYSLATMPILYASDKTTMVGGKTQNTKQITAAHPFTFNIEAFWKVGIDNENYGGYAYLNPKLGFSPIFDGYQFSPLNYGARLYAGAKWAKLYFEYGGGMRQFSHKSHDAEEAGKGNAVISYGKLEYGLRFTTNHDSDYKRSHISIGLISEKISPYDVGGFAILDPEYGFVQFDQKSKAIQGFAFQWRKDHTFNWYINFYPKFVYSGEVKDAGALSSSFSSKKTNTFFEMGFIRALDFY